MDRWIEEPVREQPWHGIGGIFVDLSSKRGK